LGKLPQNETIETRGPKATKQIRQEASEKVKLK